MKRSIIWLVLAGTIAIHVTIDGMPVAEHVQATHRLAGIIKPLYANNKISLVKFIPDDGGLKLSSQALLLVFDSEGKGEFFSLDTAIALITFDPTTSSFYLSTSIETSQNAWLQTIDNVFKYQDFQQRPLLAALDSTLSLLLLYSFTDNAWNMWRTISLPYGKQFRLYKNIRQELILEEQLPTVTRCMIALEWNQDHAVASIGYKRLSPTMYIPPQAEGTVVSTARLKDLHELTLGSFDLDSCDPTEGKILLMQTYSDGFWVKTLKEITCYHKTVDEIYFLGHSDVISVWVRKTRS